MFINGSIKTGLHSLLRQASRQQIQLQSSVIGSSLYQFQHNSFATNQEIEKNKLKSISSKEYNQIYMGGVDSIVARRRAQDAYLQKQQVEQNELAISYPSIANIEVEFELFMVHDEKESQLTDAIMNFYKMSYKRNQNFIYAKYMSDKICYEQKVAKETIRIPILRVRVSLDPERYVLGYKDIIQYLTSNNFIFKQFHLTNSAFAQQSIQFTNEFEKNLDTLFWSPVLTFENLYKTAPETYRQGNKNFVLLKTMRMTYTRIISGIAKNVMNRITKSDEYKVSRQKVLDGLKEWEDRLRGQDFHGGEVPDEADFEMYAILKTKAHSRSFQRFLENKGPDRVYRWYIRMQLSCRYDPDRIIFPDS